MKKGIRILLVFLTSLLVITGCDNKKDIKDIDKVQKETIKENKEELKNFVIQLVYCVKEFGNRGEY